MITDFEKTLDDIITRWIEAAGLYKWEDMFKDEFSQQDKIQVLEKLSDDGITITTANGLSLSAKGREIKRNITERGYVAKKRNEEERKRREDELYNISKQNLLWTKRAAWIFAASLVVAMISAVIAYFKH